MIPCLRRVALPAIAAGLVAAWPAAAQSILDRSPNLSGGWVSHSGMVHFNFLHRFNASSAPVRKVTSTPTFLLAAGLPGRLLLGAHYATNSELTSDFPNEWEFFGRYGALSQVGGAPVDLSAQVGYNLAAEGLDGEISAARRMGPARVLGSVRLLSSLPGTTGTKAAVGGSLVLRLARYVAIAGDVVTITSRDEGEDVAWSAGLQLAIPHAPHGLSLHATNANNATLQSSSRGTGQVRYGFEFTIPITLSRYFGGRRRDARPAARTPTTAPPISAGKDTIRVAIEGLAFAPARITIAPGTTVVWENREQLDHTATADAAAFDTGVIPPFGRGAATFTRPGTYAYHCVPHPFMTAVVEVR